MAFKKKESGTWISIGGSGKSAVDKFVGLLIDIQLSYKFTKTNDKGEYIESPQTYYVCFSAMDFTVGEVSIKRGDPVNVSGNASIVNMLSERDIGDFVKFEFAGTGTSKSGLNFKQIDVFTETEPNAELKATIPGYEDAKALAAANKAGALHEKKEDPPPFDEFPLDPDPDDDSLPF